MKKEIPDYMFKIDKVIYREDKIPKDIPTYSYMFKWSTGEFICLVTPLFKYYPEMELDYQEGIGKYLKAVEEFHSSGKWKVGYSRERERLRVGWDR